jgi:ATP-dependent exoDNAse (exonuclease V) alpha subunit
MLIANVDPGAGLVNGSRGVLVGFCAATNLPIVEFVNGIRRVIGTHSWPIEDYPFVSRTQIPLRLAWAVTTHKCQGSSLDCALVDIGSGNFEYGQAYVALSRARTLEGLFVHDFDPAAFRAHPTVKTFYKGLVGTQASPHPSTDVKMGAQMSKEERDTIRRLSMTIPPSTDVKEVRSEKSRPVVAVHIVKEDVEPGSP